MFSSSCVALKKPIDVARAKNNNNPERKAPS